MCVFCIRRNLFSGKRLNIFTPGTADGAESAVGNEELIVFFKFFLTSTVIVNVFAYKG